MANNLQSVETELFNLLANTTNLDATTKQKLRDRFVAAYPGDWETFLTANSLTDTAANRGKFVVDQTVRFWKDIYTAQSRAENLVTLPVSDVLQ